MSRQDAATCFLCLSLLLSPSAIAQSKGPFFRPVQNYLTGSDTPGPMAVADVNGDGKPDLLVANVGNTVTEGSVGVLLGNGDGTFQAVKTYPTGSYYVGSLVVADVDGDTHPDVLVVQANGVWLLSGNGDGTLRAPVNIPMGGIRDLVVTDINGDGKPDLVVALVCVDAYPNCGPAGAGILLGNGDGTFGDVQTAASDFLFPSSVEVTDVNHDGKADILLYGSRESIGYERHNGMAVLINDVKGGFPDSSYVYEAQGHSVYSGRPIMALGDLDGNGNPDVVVVNDCVNLGCTGGEVGVALGNGDGSFQQIKRRSGTGGWGENAIAVADIDRDGVPDLLVSNRCDDFSFCQYRTLGLLRGKGDGSFLPALSYKLGDPSYSTDNLAVGDVNGDGTPDVFVSVAAWPKTNGGTVSVLVSLFDTTTTLASSLPQSAYGQAVTLAAKLGTNGPSAPTGTVLFMNGKTWLGTAAVVNNVASLTTIHLPAGTLSLTAVYRGDDPSARSTSSVISQTVTPATTVTAIHSSLNPAAQGQPVRFTATVTSPTAKVIGTVTFSAGTTILGTVGLNSAGQASVVTSTLPTGRTKINAVYNGTPNIARSAVALQQTVN